MKPAIRTPDVRRVVVLFPSGLTLANLFFGVFAIVTASRGDYARAGWYVMFGGVADALDGRVARATNSGGRFGEELDSLVDAITFGLAPALIMYFAVLNREGWDWFWCFLFAACAVLRLARFNIEQAGTAKSYFQGLPSPAAGITLATYYWFSQSPLYAETNVANWPWHQMLRMVMAVLSFLMISNVPYPVLPNVGLRSRAGVAGLAVVVLGIALLIFGQNEYFFPIAVLYVSFGLVRATALGLIERRQNVGGGWIPGGRRAEDVAIDEHVGGEERAHRRRRRRRRSSSQRLDREDRPSREIPGDSPSASSPPPPPPPPPHSGAPRP
ncbi:MAG TPA: CDP-diacylglycerol--serine O-phosphatidyltransferase [Gemmatimonadaceae bacterium]|nr:CDP-diacylglycerol--serine O-phosphatidyltransferase [Gemmatimonadaceae bacterium]